MADQSSRAVLRLVPQSTVRPTCMDKPANSHSSLPAPRPTPPPLLLLLVPPPPPRRRLPTSYAQAPPPSPQSP